MTPYNLRALEQIEAWYRRRSFHNIIDDECCPDFSCCEPDLLEHDKEVRLRMLNKFRSEIGMQPYYDA